MQRWYLSGDRAEDYEYGIDPKLNYHGKTCLYLRSRVPQPRDFASVTQMIQASPYRNKRMRLSAALKAEGIEGWAGLWMRIDGVDTHILDNMEDRPIQGTIEWRTHEVVLDVPEQSQAIAFGCLLVGKGHLWLSDVRLEEVGRDVPTTPSEEHPRELPHAPVDLDFASLA
jgi:hypothetical protein